MTLLNRFTLAVGRRQFLVWRRLMVSSLVTNVLEPLIFLFAFGYGLGAVIDRIGELDYLVFVVPGMMCYGLMFAASFETSIHAYARFEMQRTWDAILATPVTLGELLAGEALWATLKGLLSATCVLVIGAMWGGIPDVGAALLTYPVLALGGICFACCGLAATAHARSWEFFAYYFTFWVTPMFVFSGTFFEVTRFPWFIQAVAWLLPATHLIAVVRPITASLPIDAFAAAGHLAYLIAMSVAAFALAHHRIGRRMFD